jgi:hypothetical protein
MACVGRTVAAWILLAGCADSGGRTHQWSPTIGSGDDDGAADDAGDELDVDPIDTSSTTFAGDEEGGNEGFDCNGDDAQECDCLAEPGEKGVQFCEDGVWGECMCNGVGTGDDGSTGAVDPSAGGSEGGEEATTGPADPTEVCFPGADESWSTCFPLHYFDPDAPPSGYEYPDALGGDPNYRRPVAFIDLEELDPATSVAPNFTLDELAQAFKGRWGIVQPHAVESLQQLRDLAGPLNVNSGYRSPAYNLEIGGATYSRHMYGDGFDLDPTSVSIDELELLCIADGGMLVEYETHVHCDWRSEDVAIEFFGPPNAAAPVEPAFTARIERTGELLHAPAEGFDEGEPARRWVARDAEGRVLATATGRTFAAPTGTHRVEVTVGRQATAAILL